MAVIPTRVLGSGGEVPVFALGSWNIWDRMTPDDAVALIDHAVAVGANFFDVGNYNMGPHTEGARTDVLFGEYVRSAGLRRDQYLVCGKLWLWDYPNTSFADWMALSLDRIGIDAADCVVVGDHFAPVDIVQVVRDVHVEIEAGRFRFWGVNNWAAADLETAFATAEREGLTAPSFAQLKYSLVRRSMAEGPEYGRLLGSNFGLQASDVFEGGVLIGKSGADRKIGADVGSIRSEIVAAVPRVSAAAAKLGTTPAALAVAFALANPRVGNVLFGASSRAQFDENISALELLTEIGALAIREATNGLWLDREVRSDGCP